MVWIKKPGWSSVQGRRRSIRRPTLKGRPGRQQQAHPKTQCMIMLSFTQVLSGFKPGLVLVAPRQSQTYALDRSAIETKLFRIQSPLHLLTCQSHMVCLFQEKSAHPQLKLKRGPCTGEGEVCSLVTWPPLSAVPLSPGQLQPTTILSFTI